MRPVFRVPCPKCGAGANLPCARKNGQPRKAAHRERWKASGLSMTFRTDPRSPRARSKRCLDLGWVYFAAIGDDRLKIGFTMGNPRRRLEALQTGSPYKIELVGYVPGTKRTERWLHDEFAHLRVSGEWFAFTDELRTFLELTLEDVPE